MNVVVTCPACHARSEVTFAREASCPHCHAPLFGFVTDELASGNALDQCAVCGAAHLYRQKDFNRAVGIALVVVGVLLAYFTYGLSLLAVALLDWLLFRRVGEVGLCYRCGAQYRGSRLVDGLPAFDLQLHDYYRSLKK